LNHYRHDGVMHVLAALGLAPCQLHYRIRSRKPRVRRLQTATHTSTISGQVSLPTCWTGRSAACGVK